MLDNRDAIEHDDALTNEATQIELVHSDVFHCDNKTFERNVATNNFGLTIYRLKNLL